MALRDLKNRVSIVQTLAPAARTATATGSTVDMQGFNSAVVVFNFGVWTDGTHTPTLQHSSDNVTFVTCDTNSMSGTLVAVSSAAGSNTVQKAGYTGGFRYVRAVMTIAGATTGAVANAVILRGHPEQGPALV